LYGITPEEVQAGYSNYKNTVAQNVIDEVVKSGDLDAIAELVTSGKAGIGDVASRQGVEGMDVVEDLLRGGYETPAQMAERLAAANEGLTEVDLVANLLNTGRAKPEEVASYYRNTDPDQFGDLTGADVEQYLADINEQNTTDYLKGLSDEEVGALINSGELDIEEAVKFYQDRYPGLTLADAQASMKAMGYAQGGNVSGYYLGGPTDGMADQIPATINDMQPARLSHGEFVVPADVVSHLGNGNSDAGAKELESMMDRVRKARTGTTKQGKQINPNKFLV
jgi:polyhydroxyalkanoate synthesis regulator phasin